jgi:segregation and condensation protein B
MNTTLKLLQAYLFITPEPVSFNDLGRALGFSKSDLFKHLAALSTALSGQGIVILKTDTHVQLTTSAEVATPLKQIIATYSPSLSTAALETLAIIAYTGPVSRPNIDAIRGVESKRIVGLLVNKGLIEATSNQRPVAFTVTDNFLRMIGVTARERLPNFDKFSKKQKIAIQTEEKSTQ